MSRVLLKSYEADMMLDWLMYHMSIETRHKLMAELPIAYYHYFIDRGLHTGKYLAESIETVVHESLV